MYTRSSALVLLLVIAATAADYRALYRSPRGAGYPGGPMPGFQNYPSAQNPIDPGFDIYSNLFQQHFRNLQAQQEAFQAQLQAQQEAAIGRSWATSGAFVSNPDGSFDPNAHVYSYTHSSPNLAMSSSALDSYDNAGVGSFSGTRAAAQGGFPNSGFPSQPGYGSGPHSAVASINLTPQGGYQTGEISPAAPGIFSRFAEDVPAPSGNSFGVFSSSSSSHSVGPDGKEQAFKSATTGVNDNGKISFRTVHDP